MARTKTSASPSSKAASSTKKARVLQSATENTRKTRRMFCIPPAAFARVARHIIAFNGTDFQIGKISPMALRAIQRFTETSMVDTIAKARLVMTGGDDGKKSANKTMTVKYLRIVEKAFKVAPGAHTMSAL
jgi:hypothetical protein